MLWDPPKTAASHSSVCGSLNLVAAVARPDSHGAAPSSQLQQRGFFQPISRPAGTCLATPLCSGLQRQGLLPALWGALPPSPAPPRPPYFPSRISAADPLCLRPQLPAASTRAPWLRLGRAAVGSPRPTRYGAGSSPPFLGTSTVKVRGGARVVAATPGRSRGPGGLGVRAARVPGRVRDPCSVGSALSQCKSDPSRFSQTGRTSSRRWITCTTSRS